MTPPNKTRFSTMFRPYTPDEYLEAVISEFIWITGDAETLRCFPFNENTSELFELAIENRLDPVSAASYIAQEMGYANRGN